MTVTRDDIAKARRVLADAESHAADFKEAYEKQAPLAVERRMDVQRASQKEVADRAAGNRKLSAADLREMEIDADAAELSAEQLAARANEAKRGIPVALDALNATISQYARQEEERAIRDADSAFAAASPACARAIAAAKVAVDHGDARDRHRPGLGLRYGSAGELVSELAQVRWPMWPTKIHHHGFRPQRVNQAPTDFPGVAEAVAELQAEIEAAK